jgi:Ca2+-binding EF-hand superfamily protein
MRYACAIGIGLAILLAGGSAGAQQDKPKVKPVPTVAKSGTQAASCAGRLGVLDTNRDGRIARTEFKGSPKVFAWIDADHNGFITRPEGTRAYLAMIGRLTLARMARVYRAMDTNKDGKISAAEYKGPKARFARIDANHDGAITRAEGRRAFQGYVRGAMIIARIRKMDTNKDRMISAAEFKGPKVAFARLDVNKDNRIGPGELGLVFRMSSHRPQAASARLAAATRARTVKPVSARTAPQVKVATPAAGKLMAGIQKLRKLDANKDGKVAKAEFLKACEARFAQLDRDKDGSITRTDVVKIVAALKARNSPTKVAVTKAAPVTKVAATKAPAVKKVAASKATCARKTAAAKAVAVKRAAATKPAPVKKVKATTPTAVKPARPTPVAIGIFQGLDANKDGKLLKAEMIKTITTWFDRIDSNHDRAVTRGEIQTALAARAHK